MSDAGENVKAVMFVGTDATDRGLLQYARRAEEIPLKLIFVRTADEAIACLKGEGAFNNRVAYPLPEILVIDLTSSRTNAHELLDWLARRPDLKDLQICFIGLKGDRSALALSQRYNRCFFSKAADAEAYAHMIESLYLRKSSVVEQPH
jgi:hypothetical protein